MSRADDHLEHAEKFARELKIERDAGQMGVRREEIIGDQGFALRQLIYHCTAAIVSAIDDAGRRAS